MINYKTTVLGVFLFTFSISCKFNSNNKADKLHETSKTTIEIQNKSNTDNEINNEMAQTAKVISDDEFISKVIKNDLPFSYFRDRYDLAEKQVIQNRHDPSAKDTVFVYSNDKNMVNFYVSPSNTILQEALITSPEIILDNDIRIGVKDEIFKRKFNIEDTSDVLVVENIEGHLSFTFTFEKGELKKIVYKSRYLD